MIRRHSIKTGHHKAGKSFVLLFNRVSMYGCGHPFSIQAIEEFYRSICDLLQTASPLVLMHSRGQFFLEDEPLDRNLNCFKMSSHFKQLNVSSIALFQGLEKQEIEQFVRIFLDVRSYPTAEQMKAAACLQQITHLRINHVSYRKVTEDDAIVSKSSVAASAALSDELQASRHYEEALGLITGQLLLGEVGQELSLKTLLSDPVGFSKQLVSRGAAERPADPIAARGPAPSIAAQLASLGREIREAASGESALNLTELAAALVKMKRELRDAIAAQKALGVLLDPEAEVARGAEELTDAVLLELVKKEYDQGRTPIARLALVIQRIVAPADELRRLLPKIRGSLMAEGMPASTFSELIKHLGTVIQTSELGEWMQQGAEAIGLEGVDLLARWKADPAVLARFLHLATEIERQSGSPQPLCDLMVGYIEGLVPKLVEPRASPDEASGERLRQLTAWFHSKILEGLQGERIERNLIAQVESRLQERLDASVAAIKAELAAHPTSLITRDPHRDTLLQRLEAGLPEGRDLKSILKEVRTHFGEQRLDENDFPQILERILDVMQHRRRAGMAMSNVVFDQETTCALLEKEIFRSARYGTELSAIILSVLEGAAAPVGPEASAQPPDVAAVLLANVRQQLRSSDWMGALDKDLFVAVLPMTTAKEAHLTARRLLKQINSPPPGALPAGRAAKIAGTVVHCDPHRMATADAFVRCARSEHAEMTHRLRNLKEFM